MKINYEPNYNTGLSTCIRKIKEITKIYYRDSETEGPSYCLVKTEDEGLPWKPAETMIAFSNVAMRIQKVDYVNNEISLRYYTNIDGINVIQGFTEFDRTIRSMVSDFQLWNVAIVRSYNRDDCELPIRYNPYEISRERSYTFIAGIDYISSYGGRSCSPAGKRGYYTIEELVKAFYTLTNDSVLNLTKVCIYGKYKEFAHYDIKNTDKNKLIEIIGVKDLFDQAE